MRKFMSIVTVLTLVLALAIPAFAAGEGSPVVVPGNPDAKVDSAKGEDGKAVELEVTTADKLDATEQAAAEKAAEAAGSGVTLGAPFEIEVKGDPDAKNVTVVFTYGGDGTLVGVAYQNESTGNWDYAPATKNADGTYSVTFAHFCTAVFVVKPVAQAPSGGDKKPAGSTSSGTTSPQTGFDASVYMTVAMVLVLFAGLCFVKARKVTE